jgi:hypothetical protein
MEGWDHHPSIPQIIAQPRGKHLSRFGFPMHDEGLPRGLLESPGPTQETRLIGMTAEAIQRHHLSFKLIFYPKDPDDWRLFHQAAAQVGPMDKLNTKRQATGNSHGIPSILHSDHDSMP